MNNISLDQICLHDTAIRNGTQKIGEAKFDLYTCLYCKTTFVPKAQYHKDSDVLVGYETLEDVKIYDLYLRK